MPGSQGELDPCLDEVVANRNFPTISISSARGTELLQVVRISLDEDRHVQTRQFQSVGYTFLVAEIGEDDEDAVDFIGVGFEQIGTLARIGMSFDPAKFALLVGQLDRSQASPLTKFGDIGARFCNELVREEVAVAINYGEARGFVLPRGHRTVLWHMRVRRGKLLWEGQGKKILGEPTGAAVSASDLAVFEWALCVGQTRAQRLAALLTPPSTELMRGRKVAEPESGSETLTY